jgi:hypothetical protein
VNVLALLSPALQRNDGPSAAVFLAVIAFYLVILAYVGVCGWMIFRKAGEAGWKALVPIWNTLIVLKMVGRPWWWIFLLLIPYLNFVLLLAIAVDMGRSFGKGSLFSIGLLTFLWPVGAGMLAFGSARYLGPGAIDHPGYQGSSGGYPGYPSDGGYPQSPTYPGSPAYPAGGYQGDQGYPGGGYPGGIPAPPSYPAPPNYPAGGNTGGGNPAGGYGTPGGGGYGTPGGGYQGGGGYGAPGGGGYQGGGGYGGGYGTPPGGGD